ncbi:PAS domain-containing protein [Sneathiella marina]|uniref:PAS domain-containing protein n=1 Tax=Sneathiella marina TaxID=2950108 RepID=A0ABY4VYY4_9PROT|nr:PAS domain-containing protein [Sneathiella marina]USG60048.1 PAS domain-containing protein [Sneathiella marina]
MSMKAFDEIDWITEESKQFALYWRGIGRDQLVPRRSNFDPTKIVSLLPGIQIYETISETEIISRLAGTYLVEQIGTELTGRNLLDFYPEETRAEAGQIMMELTRRPCGIITNLNGTAKSGQIVKTVAVGFPLLDECGNCNRLVFYTIVYEENGARDARTDQIEYLGVERSTFIDIDFKATAGS